MHPTPILKFIVSLALVGALVGCSENNPVIVCKKCTPIEDLPLPSSKDQLMSHFVSIYQDMDYDEYRKILTWDYKMILQQGTIDNYPFLGSVIDYDEELHIHERMFSGDPFTNRSGTKINPISGVHFVEFRRLGEWARSAPNDPIPNTEFGLFQVDILFVRPGFNDFSVKGNMEFYVTERDSIVDGVPTKHFQMAGQVDLTNDQKRPSESKAFGSWKASFD